MHDIPNTIKKIVGYLEQGHLLEAQKYCNLLLEIQPESPDGLHLAGAIELYKQNYAQAIQYIQHAIQVNPSLPSNYNNLSIAFFYENRLKDAFEASVQAVNRQPDNAAFWRQIGKVTLQTRDWQTAAKILETGVKNHSTDVELHYMLAKSLAEQNLFEQAIVAFEKVRALNPRHIASHIGIAIVLQAQGNIEKAIDTCLQALDMDSKHDGLHNALGALYQLNQAHEKAEHHFLAACQLNSANPTAHFNLGSLYERLNKLEQSQKFIDVALSLQPNYPEANLVAAKLENRQGKTQEALNRLLPLTGKAYAPVHNMEICFELGRLYDRLGEISEAFKCFSAGNVLLAQINPKIDKNLHLGIVEKLNTYFAQLETMPEPADDLSKLEHPPIFILGFPRSGTTLLDHILNSHPRINAIEEQLFVENLITYQGILHNYPLSLATLDKNSIVHLREYYLSQRNAFTQATAADPNAIKIDRMTSNILHIALLHQLFPDAKFIFALRHPCDVCLSCFMQAFAMSPATANFLTLEDSANLYHQTMKLWQRYQEILPIENNVHTIRYEALTSEPERELRSLLNFLEVEWDDSILEHRRYTQTVNRINTASYRQVSEPIYKQANNRWHKYAKHLEPVMPILQPWVETFGYG